VITSEEYIYQAGVKAGARWPELVVAQWALESARGTKVSGRNNIAGLKGPGTNKTTTEYVNGKPITIRDNFLDFNTVDDCVQYLVDRWYKDFKNHKGVNNAPSAIAAAKMLVSEGYATDPKYADKLIRIMSQQNQYADLVDAAKSFQGLQHQVKAFLDLQGTLTVEQRKRFTDTWRSRPAAPAKPKFPLNVPYFYQRDSKTGQGERMCQSSAIAMRIEQIDPKIIGDDDSYLAIVNRYGDTVSQTSHQKALASLDLKAEFRQNGNEQLLCTLLDQGIAVPIGILHKGPISKPTGGGHWVTIIGYDEKFFHVHDPFGELDLINGGYPRTGPTDGRNVRYTRQNLMKRWLVASKSDGWLWIIKK
jgi:hypothetical protein